MSEPLTQERLDEIRERMETMMRVFPENSYAVLPTLINKDIPDLLQEIKRLRAYIRTRETAQVTHYCENCEANAQAKQAAEAEVERLRAENVKALRNEQAMEANLRLLLKEHCRQCREKYQDPMCDEIECIYRLTGRKEG